MKKRQQKVKAPAAKKGGGWMMAITITATILGGIIGFLAFPGLMGAAGGAVAGFVLAKLFGMIITIVAILIGVALLVWLVSSGYALTTAALVALVVGVILAFVAGGWALLNGLVSPFGGGK